MSKPRVNTNPPANQYAGPNERIVEFTDPNTGNGGLISFKPTDARTLSVHVYRQDPGVVVSVGKPDGSMASQPAKEKLYDIRTFCLDPANGMPIGEVVFTGLGEAQKDRLMTLCRNPQVGVLADLLATREA